MLTIESATREILGRVTPTATEKVTLLNSLHRVLAEDLVATHCHPPFDRSAMDGYACQKQDIPTGALVVVAEIMAGTSFDGAVTSGKCVKIMTGAPIPDGADFVVRSEKSSSQANGKVILEMDSGGPHIRKRGEEFKTGDVILGRGTRIGPIQIALLATFGYAEFQVFKPVRVGIFSTGDELAEYNEKIDPARQIRNSNGPQLFAQAQKCHCDASYLGILPDAKETLTARISKAIEESDVTLLSGGVSCGDHDYVPDVLDELGFKVIFHKLKVKPGKPTLCAMKDDHLVFGLPGNPGAAFTIFELLVRPVLRKKMGSNRPEMFIPLMLGHDFKLKKDERQFLVPIRMNSDETIETVELFGSSHLKPIEDVIGFAVIPGGTEFLPRGSRVNVYVI